MEELKEIRETYAKKLHLSLFIMDYLDIRDNHLKGKGLTRENLEYSFQAIKQEMELRLASYQT